MELVTRRRHRHQITQYYANQFLTLQKRRNPLFHKAFRHSTTSFFSLRIRITLILTAKIYEPSATGLYAEKDIRT